MFSIFVDLTKVLFLRCFAYNNLDLELTKSNPNLPLKQVSHLLAGPDKLLPILTNFSLAFVSKSIVQPTGQ